MSNTILVSVKPKYAEMILNGSKQYEFRTKIPSLPVNKVILYVTAPVKKIVGEFEVLNTLSDTPELLWKSLKGNIGISKDSFNRYFFNRDIAYAYHIGKVTAYEKPKKLSDFNVNRAPQSFVYIN